MWPYLIPAAIGAVGGGIQAASQGKNPLEVATASLIGGGLGLGFGAGGRLAGQALANTSLATRLAPSAYRLTQGFSRTGSSLTSPLAQQMAGRQVLSNIAGGTLTNVGALAVPGLAAGLAGVPGQVLKGGGKKAAEAVGLAQTLTRQPGDLTPPEYSTGAVPDISGYGYPGLLAQQNPLGPWQANLAYQKQLQDLENQNAMRLGNYQLGAADEVKRRDLQRSAAMAQLQTNLATQSQLQLGAQRNAAAMAGQALADIGATARTQYQY